MRMTRPLPVFFLIGAFISGIFVNYDPANAQRSPPRAETDSRPTVPAPAPTPVMTPTPAATSTVTKPNIKPLTKPTPAKPTPAPTSLEISRKFPKVVTKLMVDDLQIGKGRGAKPGSHLSIHFQSWLYDPTQPLGRGPQFESTIGKTAYKFTLQNTENPHIKGWEDGLVDLKLGGKRRLIIPPDLAYGSNGAGQVIPPGATLLYEIELIDIE